ncbi:MAG: putative dependent reductase [Acidimicrobiaceae bacterium]|nr:putative dependent reductase [Acidimicrobiaceae bacterium]
MSETRMIPDAPLVSPRYARIAIVSEDIDVGRSLRNALAGGGYQCPIWTPAEACGARSAMSDFEVVFLYLAADHPSVAMLSTWPPGLVVVNVAVWRTDEVPADVGHAANRSATGVVASLCPQARVVGALQQFSPTHLELASLGLFESDAPVVADDREAADLVEAIIGQVQGLRPIYVGGHDESGQGAEALREVIRNVEHIRGHVVGVRFSEDGAVTLLE